MHADDYSSHATVHGLPSVPANRWELVTRQEPWSDIPYENPFSFQSKLEAAVVGGRRPELSSKFAWPDWYLAMMQLCWHGHPEERPTYEQLVAELVLESSSANA